MSFDHQRVIDTAVAYFLAGERCSLSLEFGRYEQHEVSAPTITNYALSVELALKLLYHLPSGQKMSGHSLEYLFNKLPDNVRDNLPYLPDCIQEIDNCFVDWRYPYEKDFMVIVPDNLRRSFIQCHEEIRRLKPGLVSVYERNWGHFSPDFMNTWGANLDLGLRELAS